MALPPNEPPRFALGLRTQITFALVLGLGLFVLLVAITAEGFASRAIERERMRVAESAASALATMLGRPDAPPIRLDQAEAALVGPGGIIGFEIVDGASRGLVGEGLSAEHALEGGGRVRVFVQTAGDDSGRALVRILVLYAALSAIAILVLSYALLTRLIVRPIAALTRAAERLARGADGARAEPDGAAEIGRLAVAFNDMSRDLSSERQALRARLRELEAASHALREKDATLVRSEKLASVGRLAAGVAHEIGNPLTSILGLIDLLETGGLDEATEREFLRRIHAETDRIHRTIRSLLDFARPSGADSPASADVQAAVERAVGLAGPQKDMRRVTLERRMPDDVVEALLAEDHLVQVILNLLMNAADAIAGEGTISVHVERVDGSVQIAIQDTGPGIDESVRANLFEPFVTTKASGKGTGLGLAVCHSIVERAGGTITAENAPQGGARFVVRVPATSEAA